MKLIVRRNPERLIGAMAPDHKVLISHQFFVKMITEFRNEAGDLLAEAILTGVERQLPAPEATEGP